MKGLKITIILFELSKEKGLKVIEYNSRKHFWLNIWMKYIYFTFSIKCHDFYQKYQKCQIPGSYKNSRLSMTSVSNARIRISLQKYVLDKQWFWIVLKNLTRAGQPIRRTHPGHFIKPNLSIFQNWTRSVVDLVTQKLFIWFWISGSDLHLSNFGIFFENLFVLGSDHKDLRQNLLPKNRP